VKSKTRVLIADDSGIMRLLIADIIKEDASIEVVDTAKNGKEAAEKTSELKPDVVLMDMNMGEYDGIYGTKRIMEENPTPIIILSAVGNTNMSPILEALKAGAVDYLNKPEKNNSKIRDIEAELISKIKDASSANLSSTKKIKQSVNYSTHTFTETLNYEIIVIGSSTGGPTAVETVITKLPSNLPIPVIIIQHMPENFIPSFAARLNQLTPLDVVVAQKDDEIKAGKIYLSPGNKNMIVKRERNNIVFDFTDKKFKEYNFPSVNSVMYSVAEIYGKKTIGVILTGMGKDGADGLLSIKNAGGITIAQNKETSVVYGMPREAFESGAATHSVSINEMAYFLVSCIE
jgi:two-component system chemotaxis response regulator CheB